MKMSKLAGRRLKELPKDAKTVSHQFLIRGGYIRPVSAGIYSLLPMGKRITDKIEKIIREEMDRIDGQEILMPVVLPAELWQESGRYEAVGAELLRFSDRNDKPMLLAMTHEECVTALIRTEINSYKQLPVMVYQLQTKYRDEARPRAGLIRTREFTMKDAYSFHTDQADLEEYYKRAHEAYERIFKRIGLDNVLSIESNSGMMGGKVSHEFMAVCECGEDTIFVSPDKKYRANREIATAAWKFEKSAPLPLEEVSTPGKKTIEEVAEFLGVKAENTGKAVFYQNARTGELIFAMIRGDFEVNESKLANLALVPELKFADDDAILAAGAVPGYASPIGIDGKKVKVVLDRSIIESSNLVVGANAADTHYKNFNADRDLAGVEFITGDIATVRAGDPCPLSGEPLEMLRGIEVGNIFQLGTKYSESMNCNYLDRDGKSHPMVMGCYGIGVGRAMASVIEYSNDSYGPIWPMSIAPYQVQVCALDLNKPGVADAAEKLVADLEAAGIEVLYDDRGEKAGFIFSDADLIGIPLRVVISPKTLAESQVEFKKRGSRDAERIAVADAAKIVADAVKSELAKYQI
ncbi:MAG: proline--tRNA ligase [Lentisphaeria bacterium]|nr:proline--tRNA ligase [Lentisphaerota bacterium]MBO5644500.1 proline--tRNA ligase [Lentisphaeria bacterium]MBO7153515.1 proline--tRNA ligase [Lentisphaeria bacterium]MBR2632271.1 proline--tRNA ligase [Lentisphaeria bacterium]